MNEWIPLFGPTVTVLGALAVALWNSRGESRDVRQLKAMNEVIAGLPADSDATRAFVDARDGMLVRVASGVAALPRQRKILWTIVWIVLATAALAFVGWLLSPLVSTTVIQSVGLAGAVIAVVASGVSIWLDHRLQKRTRERSSREVAAMLATFNAARNAEE